MLLIGSFDASGSPTLDIEITGSSASKSYKATIDTGFTGFVALNQAEMIPLGLTVHGAAPVTLGNGATIDNLLAVGEVTVSGVRRSGTILLDETCHDILIGLEFLQKFGLGLILTSNVVILHDQMDAVEAILKSVQGEPIGQPNTEIVAVSTRTA